MNPTGPLALAAAFMLGSAAGQEPAAPGPEAVASLQHSYTVRASVGPIETPLPLQMAEFLLDHPDLAAFIVRRHGIAPYTITMRGPRRSWADDGDGTQGLIDLVEQGPDRRVYYGEGTHRSRLFPAIRAASVIVLAMRPVENPGCPEHVLSRFDVYVRLRNPLLSGLVKTLRPFVRSTIIRKFSKAFLAAHEVGKLMARDPEAVLADIREFPDLTSDGRREAEERLMTLKASPDAASNSSQCSSPGTPR